jgi:hypothetical protein
MPLAGVEIGDHGENAPLIVLGRGQPQLHEDAADMLDRPFGDPELDPATAEATGAGVAFFALDPENAERLWELSRATL